MAYCCCPSSCGDMPPPAPMRIRYVGEPKLCSLLCGQEVDSPSPTDPIRSRRYRSIYANPSRMSVGILQSLVASNDKALFFDDAEMNGQRYAMCLKAFAMLYIMPAYKWTRKMLDSLMQEGAELYSAGPEDASEKNKELTGDSEMSAKVYTNNEKGIRRLFKLEGYEFEVELGEKFFPEPKGNEVEQPTIDININNLRSALSGFFKKHKYCLLSTTNLYLFIWYSDGVYFLMDFYGRNADLDLLREGGFATLICMREIRNIDTLVTQKSGLGKKDIFTLREMRLLMLVDPEGKAVMSYFTGQRADEFVRVNDDYAYLRSRLHLSLKEKDPLISRCGLPVGVAAIIASKIDHPASWDTRNLNKIVCYGFYICQCCWQYCQTTHTPIDYDSFPNQLQIGQFAVNLTIIARVARGTWHCIPRFQATDLTFAIENCWNNDQNYLLLTIHQQTYAIWRKNGFYYFFDPYRHRLPKSEAHSASLRMFASKETFFHVLNLVLLQSNIKTTFFIHRVIVTDIRVSYNSECLPPVPKSPCQEELVETKSINEGICFREDFKHCWKELGQISDDEEEDSMIEEIIEESEEEPPAGEEEGGIFGDMEGVESSDDDGGPTRRRPGRGGRAARGGGKGRSGKGKGGSDKRSTSEGKSTGKKDKGKGGKGGQKKGKSKEAGDSTYEPNENLQALTKTGKSKTAEKSRESRSKESRKSKSKSPASKTRSSASEGETASRRSKSKSRQSKSKESKSRESRSKESGKEGSKGVEKEKKEGDKSDSRKEEKGKMGGESVESKREDRAKTGVDKSDSKKDDKGKKDVDKSDNKKDEKAKVEVDKSDSKKDDKGKKDADKGDSKIDDKAKSDIDKTKKDEKAKTDADKAESKIDEKTKVEGDRGDRKDEKEKTDVGKGDIRKEEKTKVDGDKVDERGKGDSGKRLSKKDTVRKSDSRKSVGSKSGTRKSVGETGLPEKIELQPDSGKKGVGDKMETKEHRVSDSGKYETKDISLEGKAGKYEEKSRDDSGLSTTFSHLQGAEEDGSRPPRRYSDRYVEEKHGIVEAESEDQLEGTVCRPNAYPGYSSIPYNLGVAGSENGTYESICKLLRTGFKYADRVLTMTPFGNFVVFRGSSPLKKTYFVFDGCTCNVERFRRLDLTCGTAGLLCFNSLHSAITYIVDSRHIRKCIKKNRKQLVDEICSRFCQ